MNKILTIIFLTIISLSAHAQGNTLLNQEEEDSTVAVIGYFCKNDTLEYLRTQGKIKIIDNDTTVQNQIREKFMIVVTDSTSDGYKMELIPVSYEAEDDGNNYETRMASLMWENYKNLHCRFTTDEYGAVQHIENWREIRDVLKKSYVTVFDSLYASMPALDSVMPRKQLESLLLLGCSTEDGIKGQYDELEQLFGFHGMEVTMKKVEEDDVSEQGFPTHTTTESFYSTKKDEYDFDGDYVIRIDNETKLSANDMKDLLGSTFNVLFSGEINDSIGKYMKEAMKDGNKGLTHSNHSQRCYFFNGWPKLIQSITEIYMGNMFKRIEYDTIEWTSHQWGVFTFPEEEDEENGKDI